MPHPKNGYFLRDGTRVPGTTDCTSYIRSPESIDKLLGWAHRQGRDGKDYRRTRDEAADVGLWIHEGIEFDLDGIEWPGQPKANAEELAAVKNGIDGWKQWRAKAGVRLISKEQSLVSEVHRYGGTFDLVAECYGEPCIADYKPPKRVYESYVAQLAAYDELWFEKTGQRLAGAYVVRLSRDQAKAQETFFTRADLDKGFRAFLDAKALKESLGVLSKVVNG